MIYKQIRQDAAHILSELCKRKGIEIIAAECMPDHIHMFVDTVGKNAKKNRRVYTKSITRRFGI